MRFVQRRERALQVGGDSGRLGRLALELGDGGTCFLQGGNLFGSGSRGLERVRLELHDGHRCLVALLGGGVEFGDTRGCFVELVTKGVDLGRKGGSGLLGLDGRRLRLLELGLECFDPGAGVGELGLEREFTEFQFLAPRRIGFALGVEVSELVPQPIGGLGGLGEAEVTVGHALLEFVLDGAERFDLRLLLLLDLEQSHELGSRAVPFQDRDLHRVGEVTDLPFERLAFVRRADGFIADELEVGLARRDLGPRLLQIGLERLDAGVKVFCLHAACVDLRGELGNAVRLERQILLQGGDLGPEIAEEPLVANGLGGQLVFADAGAVELALEGLDALVTGAELGDLGRVASGAHGGLQGGELGTER